MKRRSFLKKSSLALGMGVLGTSNLNTQPVFGKQPSKRLPREVWIASMTLTWLKDSMPAEQRIEGLLSRMEDVVPMQPDIICLPETFPTGRSGRGTPVSEIAEKVPGPVTNIFAEFAKKNNCYIICPIVTADKGHYYNAAVVIDRKGSVVGEYRKMYPVSSEIRAGITAGPAEPPLIETDFGKIGIQICFDANWHEGWRAYSRLGAEIVFFTSMFDGGRILNNCAWTYEYYIVSSTWDTNARIIDITGDELYKSGTWPKYMVCGPVNLDKKVFHWNHWRIFDKIRQKYSRKLIIKSYQDEGCVTIESNSPDITVDQVMEEFDLITYRQYLKEEGEISDKNRL